MGSPLRKKLNGAQETAVEGGADTTSGEFTPTSIVHSPLLRYLNQHYAYAVSERGRGGGSFWAKVQRFLRDRILRGWLLKDYFAQELEFQANLVRYLNDTSRTIDRAYFQLLGRLEQEIAALRERLERVNDEQTGARIFSEQQILHTSQEHVVHVHDALREFRGVAARNEARLETLESVTRGIERILELLGKWKKSDDLSEKKEGTLTSEHHVVSSVDFRYLLFENRFRGSEAKIAERQKLYPPFFTDCTLPVLEIGSGRGELLTLLRERGIHAYGVELDAGMVQYSSAKGLDVRHEDGLSHLERLRDEALGGIIALQVIEHLPQELLERLLSLCARKVVAGGKIIFETINSQSIVALAHHYFRDPTHRAPLHPETMRFLMDQAGLLVCEVRFLSPFPKEAQLSPIEVEPYMTPKWREAVERLNHNFSRLNELLFGYQDYSIIAEVPGERITQERTLLRP